MPSAMPAARGAWWDTGSTVAPCTCAVLLSPVRGMAGGDTAGCENNVASCTVGNGLGGQGLGSGWAGAMLCKDHCVPWGQDLWLCRAAWAGDGVLCMSPAVANIHLRRCVCTCCLLQGCRHECATAANGQAGAQALVAPHGAPLHAGVRAWPPFMLFIPRHQDLHVCTLPSTLAQGRVSLCVWGVCQVPYACAHGAVQCWCHPVSVHASVQGVGIHVCMCTSW